MNLFLSVGAMKAGTTWLYSLLESNPDLYFTPEKEIHFLNHNYINNRVLRDEFRLAQAKHRLSGSSTTHLGVYKMMARWYAMYLEKPTDFKWYDRIFSLNKTKKYNCDFSNLSCHLSSQQWLDVKIRYDHIKLIYVLRDPIKRLWSHLKFHHEFAGKDMNFVDWSEKEFKYFIKRKFIWDNCTYAKYINTINDTFDEKEFMTMYFEDITSDPIVELYRIEDFLGIRHIDYSSDKMKTKVNVSKSIPAPDCFLKASMALLEPEYNKMAKSGIRIHEKWTRY